MLKVFLVFVSVLVLVTFSNLKVFAQAPNQGDLNNDGQITIADLTLLVGKFHALFCTYNLTKDCTIDLYDYNQLASKLGTILSTPTPAVSHLPESTIVSCNPSVTKPAKSINIGTQNLGQDRANPTRATQLIPQIMQKYDLDIMAIQEFYRYDAASGPEALTHVLTSLYPGKTVYSYFNDTWMSIGIVSKFPIVEKSIGSIEDRHIVHAKIRTPYGDVRVFSWHAKRDSGGSTSIACRYNRQAYDYMRTIIKPGDKIVLMGDLNANKERIFGECGGNPTELFLPNCTPANSKTCYQYSDFFVGVNGPQVHSLCSQGNFYNLVDAHILSTGTVIFN